MGEKFEVRLMELMMEHAENVNWGTGYYCEYGITLSDAVECVRRMLAEFDAVIYQP